MFTVMINALIIVCSTFEIETHLLPYHNIPGRTQTGSSHINTREVTVWHSCSVIQRTNFVFIK